ncbi:FAD-binding domain-containing protein [Mycena amicta]|nr:FAD-binding domain-containing protein [Mycena amicta]
MVLFFWQWTLLALAPLQARAVSSSFLACAAIRLELGSSIVESSGAEYDATIANVWNLFNSLEHPTCIVYPRNTGHVQVAMANIFVFGSHYAVQAGAHSGMVGWNTITNGVLISFAHMNTTTYNSASDTITLQPGVHWGDAMNVVESFGVSAIGGRATDIGTGLLLGGGISFVSPLYGWSADLIKEMDVVLVSGVVVTATETNAYSDLFRALKGGGNRFGIVTRYELYAADTGTKDDKRWFGGKITYPGSAGDAVSNASAHYIRDQTDPKAGLIVIMGTTNLSSTTANTAYLFYEGTELPTSIFGEFLSIPSTTQSFGPLSYYDIQALIAGNARGNGQQFGASSWIGDEGLFLGGYHGFQNFTNHFGSQLIAADLIISPVPRTQWAATRSGPNAIGPDPGVNYATINFYLVYDAGLTPRPETVNLAFRSFLSTVPPSPGLALYLNECDESQSIYPTYPNFAALETTYAKYDPLRFNVNHQDGSLGL